ncbi:hypothetical protein O181_026043 [Austropuccinia psidii MF-1]|uniref:Reverse transcriptase Ty1/copia-type domain-containing protein n=1 Tax=Austropuccinia psidii MF-1 TaxID=1389203 RepID=A0A9Q3CP15_9BASI|nr:hypothetical protein [Austropuccinia psidii MF-1]
MAGFDVSAAYVYSPIEEDIYVQAPVELQPKLNGKVMKLKKALYGTKQATRCWWTFSKSVMMSIGFECSEVEASLYLYRKCNSILIVWIHVDDGIFFGNSIGIIEKFLTELMAHVEIRWQANVEKIVGLSIKDKGGQSKINQATLINQYLSEHKRPVVPQYTTLSGKALVTNTNNSLDTTDYQSAIGTLMYISGG